MKHLTTPQIGTYVLTAFTFAVTQLVAIVPSMGPDKQILLQVGGAVVAAGVAVAGGIHDLASSKRPQVTTTAPIASAPASAEDKLRQQVRAAGIEPLA